MILNAASRADDFYNRGMPAGYRAALGGIDLASRHDDKCRLLALPPKRDFTTASGEA